MVRKANLVTIVLKPHDLRRHAATYASRSGTPVEIVSKVILRHADLSTTQRYLGKVNDKEAIRWIETLYGKHSFKGQGAPPHPYRKQDTLLAQFCIDSVDFTQEQFT